MNPFLAAASDPYLTDPHQYAARHRDDNPQALVDCIKRDVEYLREKARPCNHYHGAHCSYTRQGQAA